MTADWRGPGIFPLTELGAEDRPQVGAKAANLGELFHAGFPVPNGFAVAGDAAAADIMVALQQLGHEPVSVRSSALDEDLAGASFAGQYASVLGVRGDDELLRAIRRVRASGSSDRIKRYQGTREDSAGPPVAVLVQRMLTPDAAGVAFTANPITGDRDEVMITAARGLGERVVAGEAIGDEWAVRHEDVTCRRATEAVLDPGRAREIAGLARRNAEHFGVPQDVEWAVERGRPYILQTRPMTALPAPVRWMPPEPGYWVRTFRFGEWLADPLTPLCREWLLERLEEGYLRGMEAEVGAAIPFRHAAIEGWYYTTSPRLRAIPGLVLRALVRSRGRVVPFLVNALVRPMRNPERADRALLARCAARWRDEVLPGYERAVAAGWSQVNAETMDVQGLQTLVDDLGRLAGEYFWSLALVGGAAWKMERCLARFLERHLPEPLRECAPQLLRGLAEVDLSTPSHAVQSIDWYWPTAGESASRSAAPDLHSRRAALSDERAGVSDACRAALTEQAVVLTKFDGLLEVTQGYAIVREAQARWFTLAWPLLRVCAMRLGAELERRAVIGRAEDVFFPAASELGATTSLDTVVRERRQAWEKQPSRVAPLGLGAARGLMRKALSGSHQAQDLRALAEGTMVGEPASPGRATGPVCVVRGLDDFVHFHEGSVLVARATAPAWTPLFGRAAAVVTDAGTLAAHASLVAREYGISAVVATGDATSRLCGGQIVTVDGTRGIVELGAAIR